MICVCVCVKKKQYFKEKYVQNFAKLPFIISKDPFNTNIAIKRKGLMSLMKLIFSQDGFSAVKTHEF